jgi:hypothetical protein
VRQIVSGSPEADLEVVDIDSEDELLLRYLERIPVVEVDGVEVSELVFEPAGLLAALKTA